MREWANFDVHIIILQSLCVIVLTPHLRHHKLISLVNSCRIYRILAYSPRHAQFFKLFFSFFHLFKKVSKEKRAMLDDTKTQSDGRNTEGALQQDG